MVNYPWTQRASYPRVNLRKGDILLCSVITEDTRRGLTCVHECFLKQSPLWWWKNVYFYFAGVWEKLFLKDAHTRWKQKHSVQTVDYIFPKQLALCHIADIRNAGWLLKMGLVGSLHVDSKKEKYYNTRHRSREILEHGIQDFLISDPIFLPLNNNIS